MNFLRSQVMQKAKRIRTRCALDVSRECFVRGYDGGHGGLTSFPVPQTLYSPPFSHDLGFGPGFALLFLVRAQLPR